MEWFGYKECILNLSLGRHLESTFCSYQLSQSIVNILENKEDIGCLKGKMVIGNFHIDTCWNRTNSAQFGNANRCHHYLESDKGGTLRI